MEARPLTLRDKQTVCGWHYPGRYAVYDLPSWEKMARRQMGFADPVQALNYYGFWEGDALVGYVNLRPEEGGVSVGIGVDPARCGQGLGRRMLRQAVQMAAQRWPDKRPCLVVRTWNRRAVRCYQAAGFQVEGEPFRLITPAGEGDFYRMTWNPPQE